LATDLQTERSVVVKLLLFGVDFIWDDLKLFEREAAVLKSLDHPAIPQYLDYFEVKADQGNGFALVQTYLGAKSLQDWVQSGRTFSETELKMIAKELLDVLDYLHCRQPSVVHRDLKPSNILLGDRTGHSLGKVYLVDFGSVQAGRDGGTRTIVGTYGYMPPEQFGGRATPVSDLYSLGATLIYLGTGQHPSELMTDELRLEFQQIATLSAELTTWLKRILQPAPSKRFASAGEALQALEKPQGRVLSASHSPVGSPVIIKYFDNQISIELPYSYLRFPEQLNHFMEKGALIIGLILFVLIFTVSPWHIMSCIAFMYLCDLTCKVRLYKILINPEEILFKSFFMGRELGKWTYPQENICRLDLRMEPLLSWAKGMVSIDQQRHQIVLNIGAKSYIIQSINEIEIGWLAHELSRFLSLPVNLLKEHEANDQAIAAPQLAQSKLLGQQEPRLVKNFGRRDSASSLFNKPANSKVQLIKTNESLEIIIPPSRFRPGVIVFTILISIYYLFITGWIIRVLSGIMNAWNSGGLIGVIFLICFSGFGFLMLWMQRGSLWQVLKWQFKVVRLRINSSEISLSNEMFGLVRLPILTDDSGGITKIEVIPSSQANDDEAAKLSRHLSIQAGTHIFKLGEDFYELSERELDWLAEEVRYWLDLPMT
jgi:hypothetical protein